jgi:hypothetical protein
MRWEWQLGLEIGGMGDGDRNRGASIALMDFQVEGSQLQ